MTQEFFPRLGETLYSTRLPNGLQVLVVKKPGFSKKIAYYAANCGGIHQKFRIDGVDYTVPQGSAHFLEHKQFDMPERDITAEFTALGAYPNAFTGYDTTAYYFSCTENFPACLSLLLEYVSTPYYTAETVKKELGIIGQEIDMNLDAPESRGYEAMLDILYENHPIKTPILGTRQTIGEITPETLYLCHRAYYHPKNSVLAVVGDVDPEEVAAIAESVLPKDYGTAPEVVDAWEEPMERGKKEIVLTMEVPKPVFSLAFKSEDVPSGESAMMEDFIGDMAAEILCGESSPLYEEMYREGLIDTSFSCGFDAVNGAAMLIFTGEGEDAAAVRQRILSFAGKLSEEGIDEKLFLRLKKSFLGQRLQGLDSLDSTCYRLCCGHFIGYPFFRFPEVLEKITAEDVLSFIRRVVKEERSAMSIVMAETTSSEVEN